LRASKAERQYWKLRAPTAAAGEGADLPFGCPYVEEGADDLEFAVGGQHLAGQLQAVTLGHVLQYGSGLIGSCVLPIGIERGSRRVLTEVGSDRADGQGGAADDRHGAREAHLLGFDATGVNGHVPDHVSAAYCSSVAMSADVKIGPDGTLASSRIFSIT